MPDSKDEARFWSKVARRGDDECWHWIGGITEHGYGRFSIKGRVSGAHRDVFAFIGRTIPNGLHVDHLCHNRDLSCPGGRTCLHRRCVNPAHLELVTKSVNAKRGRGLQVVNAAKTRCPQGHPYDSANTYRPPVGSRVCRICVRVKVAQYKARKAMGGRTHRPDSQAAAL